MRIASLLPSATEILFGVGAGAEVVAVTHECDFPAEARGLPRVTADTLASAGAPPAQVDRHIRQARHAGSSIYELDARRLADLEPDLIVTQELCDVCAVAYRDVERAVRELPGEVPIISLEPGSLDEIVAAIEAVGRATDHVSEAAGLASRMRRRIDAVASRPRPGVRPRVVCIEWTDPIMIGGHWIPEMVDLAGGVDVLGVAHQPSRYVEWEQVIAAAPEVLVLMPCGYGLDRTLEAAAGIIGRPGFDNLPCALGGRVAAVDGSSYFNRPGPRIAEGLEILAAVVAARPQTALPSGAAWVTRAPLRG